jgi:hypothetical protein
LVLAFYQKKVDCLGNFPEKRDEVRTSIADIYVKLEEHQNAIDIYTQAHKVR